MKMPETFDMLIDASREVKERNSRVFEMVREKLEMLASAKRLSPNQKRTVLLDLDRLRQKTTNILNKEIGKTLQNKAVWVRDEKERERREKARKDKIPKIDPTIEKNIVTWSSTSWEEIMKEE